MTPQLEEKHFLPSSARTTNNKAEVNKMQHPKEVGYDRGGGGQLNISYLKFFSEKEEIKPRIVLSRDQ